MSRTEVVEQSAAEVDTSGERRSWAVLVGVVAACLLGLVAVYTVGCWAASTRSSRSDSP
jgi:nitrate reductase NapE component